MDKYEEEYLKSAVDDIDREILKRIYAKKLEVCTPVTLEKARKFDQLVEARKKATPGEWYSKPAFDGLAKVTKSIRTADDECLAIITCSERSINIIKRGEQIETVIENNADFIALAANLTREDK